MDISGIKVDIKRDQGGYIRDQGGYNWKGDKD